jgi:MFS superfamily sulfate permease-like transporter
MIDVERDAAARPVPGVVVLRPETALFFANAEAVRTRIRSTVAQAHPAGVVLDAETVPTIDLTAVGVLDELAADLAGQGIAFVIARDVGQVRDVFARAPGAAEGGGHGIRTYRLLDDAIEAVRPPAGGPVSGGPGGGPNGTGGT